MWEQLNPWNSRNKTQLLGTCNSPPNIFLRFQERWSRDIQWEVYYTKLYKNKGKKTDMPFEEAEIQLAGVHYAYVCKKPGLK